MATLAELEKRIRGATPMSVIKRDHRNGDVLQKPSEKGSPRKTESRRENNGGLGECGGTDRDLSSIRHGADEWPVALLSKENRHDGRAIEDHTPSGP